MRSTQWQTIYKINYGGEFTVYGPLDKFETPHLHQRVRNTWPELKDKNIELSVYDKKNRKCRLVPGSMDPLVAVAANGSESSNVECRYIAGDYEYICVTLEVTVEVDTPYGQSRSHDSESKASSSGGYDSDRYW